MRPGIATTLLIPRRSDTIAPSLGCEDERLVIVDALSSALRRQNVDKARA
jgi:hypothetical protein